MRMQGNTGAHPEVHSAMGAIHQDDLAMTHLMCTLQLPSRGESPHNPYQAC